MPQEYKEVERALLARFFRAGLIDATTFYDRLLKLNYSPEDSELMVKLEAKEYGKEMVLLTDFEDGTMQGWSVGEVATGYVHSGTYCARFGLDAGETKSSLSKRFDVTAGLYLMVTVWVHNEYFGTCAARLRFYTSDGTRIADYIIGTVDQMWTWTRAWFELKTTIAVPPDAVEGEIVVIARASDAYAGGFRWDDVQVIKVYALV